jgi:hypothetical protein
MTNEISIILYSVSMIIFAIAALIIFEKYDDDK